MDGSTREEVRAFYNTVFHASEGVPLGWTGNISTGEPGTTSLEHRQAVILRVNAFRAMAGVPSNITLNDVYSRKAQQAALLMSANTNVSHFPSRDWLFYTDEAAEAARNSNLSLGDEGPQAVLGQIRDDGANNSEVGLTAAGFSFHQRNRWERTSRATPTMILSMPFGCSTITLAPARRRGMNSWHGRLRGMFPTRWYSTAGPSRFPTPISARRGSV